jgi:hypothetical protein
MIYGLLKNRESCGIIMGYTGDGLRIKWATNGIGYEWNGLQMEWAMNGMGYECI